MDNLLSLQELFDKRIFRIPDYQRGYSWRSQQLEEFWDDLLSLLPNQDHYTGMISLREVSKDEIQDEYRKWQSEQWLLDKYQVDEVVDGQQRLTTFIILINEIVDYCKSHGITELKSNKTEKLKDIEAKYLFKQKPGNIIRTYMFGYEVDNPSYEYFKIAILDDPGKASLDETFYTLNLNNAKRFFQIRLKDLTAKQVEEIYAKVVVSLKFNLYNIKDNFNVFVAFETMNNRGKRLSYLELLKNRLIYLSTVFKNDNNEKAIVRDDINDAWREVYGYLGKNKKRPLDDDEFLRDHWIIYFGYQTRLAQGGKSIPFNVFLLNKFFIQQNIDRHNLDIIDEIVDENTFSDDVNFELNSDEEYITEDEEEQIQDEYIDKHLSLVFIKNYVGSLKELIPFWYQTFDPSSVGDTEIAKYLFRLNILGYVNARPLATVILSKNNVDNKTKAECLRLIERFNFLYFRLNNYAQVYNSTVFYNLARDLYRGDIDIDEVLMILRKDDSYYLSANHVIVSDGPVERFNKLMKRDGYYSWGTLKYLLYLYDLSLSEDTVARQKIDPDEYFRQDPKDQCSIEHIYPRKPTDDYWVSHFGKCTEKQKLNLQGSLGNMLPLSLRINKRLQNDSFSDKKNGTEKRNRGYINGSSSEMEVAKYRDWTPEHILERGMGILNFMEKEFDFKFPNDSYRKKILGLEYTIKKRDAWKNKTNPV